MSFGQHPENSLSFSRRSSLCREYLYSKYPAVLLAPHTDMQTIMTTNVRSLTETAMLFFPRCLMRLQERRYILLHIILGNTRRGPFSYTAFMIATARILDPCCDNIRYTAFMIATARILDPCCDNIRYTAFMIARPHGS